MSVHGESVMARHDPEQQTVVIEELRVLDGRPITMIRLHPREALRLANEILVSLRLLEPL